MGFRAAGLVVTGQEVDVCDAKRGRLSQDGAGAVGVGVHNGMRPDINSKQALGFTGRSPNIHKWLLL